MVSIANFARVKRQNLPRSVTPQRFNAGYSEANAANSPLISRIPTLRDDEGAYTRESFLNFVRLTNYCVKPLFIVQYFYQDFSAAQFYAQG